MTTAYQCKEERLIPENSPCPHSFSPCEWTYKSKLIFNGSQMIDSPFIESKRVTKVFCSLCLETKELE